MISLQTKWLAQGHHSSPIAVLVWIPHLIHFPHVPSRESVVE